MLAAQKALDEANAAKKSAEDITRLKGELDTAQKAYNAEVLAEQKKLDDKANGTKSAQETQDEADRKALEEVVTKALKTSLSEQLGSILPKSMLDQLTPEAIAGHVKAAITSHFSGENAKAALDQKSVDGVMTKAIGLAIDGLKKDSTLDGKGLIPAADAQARGQIEIPTAWTKGNLPLHGKQLLNRLMGKHEDEGVDKRDLAKGQSLEDAFWHADGQMRGKALTTTGTGTGAELVPRNLSSELYRRMFLDSELAAWWMARIVDMPTDVYDYPLVTTRPVFKMNNVENRDAEASDPGTANFTLTSKKLMALVQYSYEADEASIIPILPTIQTLLAESAAAALETALINGDTTSTHQDSDITDVNDAAKAWKGFRKLALAVSALKSDISSGGISRANALAVLKLLGKYGVKNKDLVWVVGSKAWSSLLGLDEFALAYASGRGSTFIDGGRPPCPWGGTLVVSEQARENLNASGVYDNSTTTKGAILAFSGAGFVMGSRRRFMIEVGRNIKSQTNDIVASFRTAFQPVETPSATVSTVACGFNYTS